MDIPTVFSCFCTSKSHLATSMIFLSDRKAPHINLWSMSLYLGMQRYIIMYAMGRVKMAMATYYNEGVDDITQCFEEHTQGFSKTDTNKE